jgi:transcriptional regulator with XRE-family HTH domain
MDIAKRLKEFRKKTNIKMPAIAAATGISKENLYKWEKGTKPSDFTQYKELEKYLDEMENAPEHILEDARSNGGNLAQIASPALFTGIFLSQDDAALPLAEKNGVPGSIITINNQPILIAWRMESPFMGEVDGVIPVTGDSMEPKFKSGNLVALKKLRFTKIINAGYYYYIIDKNHIGLLRRVRPAAENNSIILAAENEKDYPEITRKMDDVLAIFSIEAVIMK